MLEKQKFSRRTALQTLVLGAAGVMFPISEAKAQLKGRIKQSVTSGIGNKLPPDQFFQLCKEMGLVGLDFVGADKWPLLKKHGLVCTLASGAGSILHGAADKRNHAGMLQQFNSNIKAAAEYKWRNVITMSGQCHGMSDEEGMDNCLIVLKEAVKIAEDYGVTICMELLNSKVNHPDYMCDHTAWGVELCKRVGSPRFKLLYDIYHMQIQEGDIIRTIRQSIDYIGHFHTAGNPGRNDLDDEQELYYPAIMRAIARLTEEGRYDGYVAHEFGAKSKNKLDSLRHAVQVCDV